MFSCMILSAGSHRDINTAQHWNKKYMSVVSDREMSYVMFPLSDSPGTFSYFTFTV